MGWKITAAFLALLTISSLRELVYIMTSPEYASFRGQVVLTGSVMVLLLGFCTYKAWKEGTKKQKGQDRNR